MRTILAVLPVIRRQRSGTIVNISSRAELLGYPGAAAYVGSKHLIEGMSESITYELEPLG